MDNTSFQKYPIFSNLTKDIVELIKKLEIDLKRVLGNNAPKTQDIKKGSLFSKINSFWPFKYFSKKNPSLKEYVEYNEKTNKIIEEILVENLGNVILEEYNLISPIIDKFKLDFRNIIHKYADKLENELKDDVEKSKSTKPASPYSRYTDPTVGKVETGARSSGGSGAGEGTGLDELEGDTDDNPVDITPDEDIEKSQSDQNQILNRIFSVNFDNEFEPRKEHIDNGNIKKEFFPNFLNWLIHNGIDIKNEDQVKNKLENINYNPTDSFYENLLIIANRDEELANNLILRTKHKDIVFFDFDFSELTIGSIEGILNLIEDEYLQENMEMLIDYQKLIKKIIEKNKINKKNKLLVLAFNLATNKKLHENFIEKLSKSEKYNKFIK